MQCQYEILVYVFTQKIVSTLEPTLTLALTADERTRSRYRYRVSSKVTNSGYQTEGPDEQKSQKSIKADDIYLELPRGTTLRDGDCLVGDGHSQVLRIVAKPEQVLTVKSASGVQPALKQPDLRLLQAAYHLGNRHVALEIGADYLRLSPDPVLATMLRQLGVVVTMETVPFQPEPGAYGHHH